MKTMLNVLKPFYADWKWPLRIFIGLWMGLLIFPTLLQAQLEQKKDKLQEYKQIIEKQRSSLKRLSVQERSLYTELKNYSLRVTELEQELSSIKQTSTRLERQMKMRESKIQKLQADIDSRENQVSRRLRELYKWGTPNYMKAFLSSKSQLDLRYRQNFVHRWIEEDYAIIGVYRKFVQQLELEKNQLRDEQQKHDELFQHQQRKKTGLNKTRKEYGQFLLLVRDQQEYYRKSVEELEKAAKNLEKFLQKFQDRDDTTISLFAQKKGELVLPVNGILEREYGPYVDTNTRIKVYHKGIDIRAAYGSDVRAVFGGKVVYATWFTGYGQVLILDHGNGYFSIYAHLSTILCKSGDFAVVSQVIGKVGDTDSLKGSYLYFELRYKGVSEDPWPWFRH